MNLKKKKRRKITETKVNRKTHIENNHEVAVRVVEVWRGRKREKKQRTTLIVISTNHLDRFQYFCYKNEKE